MVSKVEVFQQLDSAAASFERRLQSLQNLNFLDRLFIKAVLVLNDFECHRLFGLVVNGCVHLRKRAFANQSFQFVAVRHVVASDGLVHAVHIEAVVLTFWVGLNFVSMQA